MAGGALMENGSYICELKDYPHYTDNQQKKAPDAFFITLQQ